MASAIREKEAANQRVGCNSQSASLYLERSGLSQIQARDQEYASRSNNTKAQRLWEKLICLLLIRQNTNSFCT